MGAFQAVSAVAGYNQASSQTSAKNKQILANYNQRRVAYEKGNLDRLAIYGTKVTDVEINQDEIGIAALNAISTDTLAEAEADRQLEAKLLDIQLAKLRGSGKADEGGRARSYGKNPLLAAGRQQGAIRAQRDRLKVGSLINRNQTLAQANRARTEQWRSVNLGAGQAGPAPKVPTFLKGPSKLGLMFQLAGAALTAAAPMFKGAGASSGAASQSGAASAGTKLTNPGSYLNNSPSQFVGGTQFNFTPAPTYPNVTL